MKPILILCLIALCGCSARVEVDSRPTVSEIATLQNETPEFKYRIVKRDGGYIAQGYYGSLRWCDIGHTKPDVESICRDIEMLKRYDAAEKNYVPPYAKPQDETNVVNCKP